jgi:ZIP family zinc transporter
MLFDIHAIPWEGALGSLCAGSATVLGALAVFVIPKSNPKVEDALLSFAAGVMLAASFFGLILVGLETAEAVGYSAIGGVSLVVAGILLGTCFVWALNHYAPHEHFILGKVHGDARHSHLARIWLFVITIAIHNFPEGMAVGVGFADGNTSNGMSLAFGIGLQNVPEGLAVAVALLAAGYSRIFSFIIASITGLLEPVGGVFGVISLGFTAAIFPVILGFAGGAMLFIISDEIIPETHRKGNETIATFSLIFGFILMMFFDVIFG